VTPQDGGRSVVTAQEEGLRMDERVETRPQGSVRWGAGDYDLLVVGSANADLVIGVERRPAAGETVLGSDLTVHPGGKGANQAVAAARLGARTALLARVGDDAHGRLLLDSQRAAGVDTDGVLVGGAPTGVALITVDPSGDNSIVVSPGANGRLTPGDIRGAGELLARARVVSLQLEIPLDTVAEVARALPSGTRLVLNPSPPAPLPEDVLAVCDPLVVNEHEARYVLGEAGDRPEDWARDLLALGPRSVVVTLGAEGALVADAGGCVRLPSPEVDAVDTTGAGDAFTAALAWRLGLGQTLAEAAGFAVRVGAAAVTGRGAQESFPRAGDSLPGEGESVPSVEGPVQSVGESGVR
jgi:ribokinase